MGAVLESAIANYHPTYDSVILDNSETEPTSEEDPSEPPPAEQGSPRTQQVILDLSARLDVQIERRVAAEKKAEYIQASESALREECEQLREELAAEKERSSSLEAECEQLKVQLEDLGQEVDKAAAAAKEEAKIDEAPGAESPGRATSLGTSIEHVLSPKRTMGDLPVTFLASMAALAASRPMEPPNESQFASCTLCKEKFGLLRWRTACQVCCRVFCGGCCAKTIEFRQADVRTCDICFILVMTSTP